MVNFDNVSGKKTNKNSLIPKSKKKTNVDLLNIKGYLTSDLELTSHKMFNEQHIQLLSSCCGM